jgi:hypothetical protein
MMVFLFYNCYSFVYKMREYKNVHSVLFYTLSFICIVARIIDMSCLLSILSSKNSGELDSRFVLLTGNITYFISVYFKIALGYSQVVSTMYLVVALAST